MKPGARKNNPFKKNDSTSNASPASSNLLGHLTGKAIGFDSPRSSNVDTESDKDQVESSVMAHDGTENGSAENNENQPKNSNSNSSTPASGQLKFFPWFARNKEQLKEENPNATEEELVKIATRQFKTLNSYTTPRGVSEKRKLDEGEKGGSGVSKLARFGFVKN